MITIIVTRRPQATARSDYHSQIENHPELWANGWTADEAVGNLIRTHSEQFGLQDCAGLVDNPNLNYSDIGELVRRDSQKFGIEIRQPDTL